MPLTAQAVSFTLCPLPPLRSLLRGTWFPRPLAGVSEAHYNRTGCLAPTPKRVSADLLARRAAASSGVPAAATQWERPKRTPWAMATNVKGSGSLALSVPRVGSEGWMLNLTTIYVFLEAKKQDAKRFLFSFGDA